MRPHRVANFSLAKFNTNTPFIEHFQDMNNFHINFEFVSNLYAVHQGGRNKDWR